MAVVVASMLKCLSDLIHWQSTVSLAVPNACILFIGFQTFKLAVLFSHHPHLPHPTSSQPQQQAAYQQQSPGPLLGYPVR